MNMLSPRHRILAGGVDASDLVMGVVPGVVDPRGHRPRGRAPNSRRRPLLQRLVRTLLVEVLAKRVESLLLFARAQRRRLRRLLRQRAVHPLVSTIVLRRSRTAEMRLDAQLQQPYRQSRKPTGARRSERRPVVGADRVGKPEVPEKALENRPDLFMVGPKKSVPPADSGSRCRSPSTDRCAARRACGTSL